MPLVAIVIAFLLLAIFLRLLAGGIDGDRIDAYFASRACEVLDRSWDPFGKGWFGEKNDRIYKVVYRHSDGSTRRATVKTSMFSGVYLTDEEIVSRPAHGAESEAVAGSSAASESIAVAALRAENARLRAELARRGEEPAT